MIKKSIFISHTSAEKEIALTLKEWVDSSFLGVCDVFVSSSPDSISPGQNWLDEVCTALKTTNLQLILCSKQSLTRPWINFEAGFAFAQGITIIPLCHSGVSVSDLPIPLALFQAINLESDDACKDIFAAIAKFSELRVPKIAYLDFKSELGEAIKKTPEGSILKHCINQELVVSDEQPTIPNAKDKLPSECINILSIFLAREEVYDTNIRQLIENPVRADYFRDILVENNLLSPSYNMRSPTTYRLSKKGRAFLVEQGLC